MTAERCVQCGWTIAPESLTDAPSWQRTYRITYERLSGRTFTDIAAEYGVTPERIRQICSKGVARLSNEHPDALEEWLRSGVGDPSYVANVRRWSRWTRTRRRSARRVFPVNHREILNLTMREALAIRMLWPARETQP